METYSRRTKNPRIAIYSQDGFGLGHMRRTSAIAWQIFQARNDACILTLSDSPLGQFFRLPSNHDYVKLPSIVKSGPGNWRSANMPLDFPEVLTLRQQIIRSTLLSFSPDILLVDHMPHGAMGELIPALKMLKECSYPTKIILGLRDILDAPEVIEQRWHVEGAFETIQRYYDQVLVYGMRDVYDVVSKYHFPKRVGDLVHFCGYVSHASQVGNVSAIRSQYLEGAPEGAQLIVAMAGGGADAYPMMSALLDALPLVRQSQPCVIVIVTGPFMPPHLSADLVRRASNLQSSASRIQIIDSVDDTLRYIYAADLVISMAGYNTTIEILGTEKPAILIPRAGPSAEQRTRASLFAARHWVETIDPIELTPNLLAQTILSQLVQAYHVLPEDRPNLQGVFSATNQILRYVPAPKKQVPINNLVDKPFAGDEFSGVHS